MDKKLKRSLSLLDVFCFATGAMISSGLFILPGLAFSKAGPAVILSYILASFLCIPTILSSSELTTAMPKAGGDYYFIMRGFGPLFGTIAGFCSWFSLSLKAAFALIGVGAYLTLVTNIPMNMIALICCLVFILLNLRGAKEAGRFQVVLVIGLLAILIIYCLWGFKFIDYSRFNQFFSRGVGAVLATASFVFISYGGIVKITAVAEEVDNPGRNLPLGMLLSLLVTSILYGLVIFVTVGVVNPQDLSMTLTPISDGARMFGGNILTIVVSIGALLAFISTANAGIMAASRYPFGMSRDRLLPQIFQKLDPISKTPTVAILVTGAFMIAVMLGLKLELLVKVASAILILLFIMANITVIIFRKSNIASYRPKFRSPLYPYMQMAGIAAGVFLLVEMGSMVIFLMMIFLLLGFTWYKAYVEKRVSKDCALIYVLEKLVSKDAEFDSDSLLVELKDIVVERDKLIEDRFHKLVETSLVMDIDRQMKVEEFFGEVAALIAKELSVNESELADEFMKREHLTSTVVRKGLAIPHVIIKGKNVFRLILVRAREGVVFPDNEIVHTIFVLAGSSDERNFHLKVLAAIAQITHNPEFDAAWLKAANTEALKNLILLADRRRE